MTKVVLVVLLIVVGGVVGWLHWSPRHTERQLGEAVLATDTATIAQLVNFPKVQDQLVADIQAARKRVARDGKRPNMDSLAQVVPLVAWELMRPHNQEVIERVTTTPGGFIDMVTHAYWVPEGQPLAKSLWMKFVEFPTTFEIGRLVETAPNSDTARFLLRRSGTRWQVEEVRFLALCQAACR